MEPNQKYKIDRPLLAVNEDELRRVLAEVELLSLQLAALYTRIENLIKQGESPNKTARKAEASQAG